jgi:uncharacterized protein YndB with AHSA1/START domain
MTSIKLERRYRHSTKRVWRALTDRAAISEWGMKTDDFEPKVGAKFILRGEPNRAWRGFVECEVVECIPEKIIAYTWQGNEREPPTLVRFILEADGDGTKLSFEHSGFRGIGGWMLARFVMGPGWKKMLEGTIFRVLEASPTAVPGGVNHP